MTVPAPFVYNATVVAVHDADTIYVVVDRGMYDYKGSPDSPVPVRILGMNARELSQPGGPEARNYVASLLPAGSKVVLHTAKPDKYAPRWDALIETPTLPDLTAHLIETQWAAPWNGVGAKPIPPWPRPLPQ